MKSMRMLNLATAAVGLAYGHLPNAHTMPRSSGGNYPFDHGYTITRSTKHPGCTGKRRRRRNRHKQTTGGTP